MRQFLKTIERFTNQINEDKKMELVELITKSPENFRAAFERNNTLLSAVENIQYNRGFARNYMFITSSFVANFRHHSLYFEKSFVKIL